jgi:hypothetical protein
VSTSASNIEIENCTCCKCLHRPQTERLEITHAASVYIRLKHRDRKLHMVQVSTSASNREIATYTCYKCLYRTERDRKLRKLLSPYIFNVCEIFNKSTFINFLWCIFVKIILYYWNEITHQRHGESLRMLAQTVMNCIEEVPSSNLCQITDYPVWGFNGFPQSL